MAGRAATRTAPGRSAAGPFAPAAIRNVVLVGPSGAGKTTLVETLLAHAGVIGRAGSAGVAPLYLPVRVGQKLTGLYGLLSRSATGPGAASAGPPRGARDARAALIEGIIEQSEDESLMERYLGGEDIELATLVADLETAVARGSFHPVVPVCSASGIGLDALLEVLVGGFPSPLEHPLPAVTGVDGAAHPPLLADPDGPLAAEVVRTSADAYVGRVSLVRVFSGTLRPDSVVHVSGHHVVIPTQRDGGHDADERLAHVHVPLGATLQEVDAVGAGDIAALTRLTSAETGDTVSAAAHPLLLPCWELPEPLLPVAVVARTRGDEDALVKALAKIVAADPALHLDRDAETHQTVLWCTGEAHADVVLSRLRAGGAAVDTEPVRVALRETLAGAVRATGRHVKQSGGHGQYAVCHVEFEPLPRGAGFEFVSKVVGGAVPTAFVPSVEKGIRAQFARGVTDARCPVVDVRATLVDGKAHSVDSSDAAFQTAGALALREAAAAGGTVVLEPFDEVAVRTPDESLGAVLGDLSGRRGRVLGTEVAGPGRSVVRAEVPRTELLRYPVDLRAMTAGAATFTRRFGRYDVAST